MREERELEEVEELEELQCEVASFRYPLVSKET
jgi:hypothetical protein